MKQHVQLFMFCQTDPVYEQLHKTEFAHVYQFDETSEQLLNSDFGELLKVIGKTVSASIITDNKNTLFHQSSTPSHFLLSVIN